MYTVKYTTVYVKNRLKLEKYGWLCLYRYTGISHVYIPCIKGAACRILTLLKHKNTIICLQIFKKHAKVKYFFYLTNNATVSYFPLIICVFRPGMSVFVMVCETRQFSQFGIPGSHLAENTAYLISFIVVCARFCWCR